MRAEQYDSDISLCLETEFDMNIIVSHIDIMISDYSSAMHKAVYYHKPVIHYLIDMEGYKKYDLGLKQDFLDNLPGYCAYTPIELIKAIETAAGDLYFQKYHDVYREKFMYFFGGKKSDYKEICDKLFQIIYGSNRL